MLSYRHAFHAGNFADVFKHVLLVQLILALRRKDKPFCVFDTHAGAGRYDLRAAPARQNQEFADGIARVWNRSGLGPELSEYRRLIQAGNPDGKLRFYPGSPYFAHALLRPEDRLILTELHPGDFPLLQAEFAGDRRVMVQQADGYARLKAVVPPRERRGLVFIDPAFELRDEFARLTEAVQVIHQRWASGMAAIWYPLLELALHRRLQRTLRESGIPAILCAELQLHPDDSPPGLRGCGMIIINPPWQLDDMLNRLLPELLSVLRVGADGQTRLEWLAAAP